MWNLKKVNSWKQRADWWWPETRGMGVREMSECSQKVQISSFKTDKLWKQNLQHSDYS